MMDNDCILERNLILTVLDFGIKINMKKTPWKIIIWKAQGVPQ